MADGFAARCEELAHQVLGPLVLGGPVRPVRPFGGPLALAMGTERGAVGRLGADLAIVDRDLRLRIDVARLRRARLLAPVDMLPPLGAAEWSLAAGLNDLLQVTNHHLAGVFTRGRYQRLVQNVRWLCERVAPPADVGAALGRHATLGRALELVRTDSKVSWWTGSASFRGEPAPPRLTAWKELRRVRIDAERVPLAEMSSGVSAVDADDYLEVLGLWLGRSPLTDLATLTRKAPAFGWSTSTLSLISAGPGRKLAYRAVMRGSEPAAGATSNAGELAASVLREAAAAVPATLTVAKALAVGFADEVGRGQEQKEK